MPSGWRGPSKPRPRGAGRVRLGPSCALGPGAFVLARDRGSANFPIISSEHEHPHLQLAPRLHESLHPLLPLPSTALFLPLLTAKLLERANLLPVFLECSRAPQAFHPTPQLQGEGSPCTPRREAQRSDAAPSGGSALRRGPVWRLSARTRPCLERRAPLGKDVPTAADAPPSHESPWRAAEQLADTRTPWGSGKRATNEDSAAPARGPGPDGLREQRRCVAPHP